MTTRRQHYNSRAKSLGDVLTLLDKQTGWHKVVDTANVLWPGDSIEGLLAAGHHPRNPYAISSLDTCIEYLNELKARYNLHIASTTYHDTADATNASSAADATDLASAYTLAIELKGDFNAHIAAGAGTAHTHSIPAHTHSLFLNDAGVADGATTRVNAGTNLLSANTGTDITIAGVADATGEGGILQVAAGVTGSGGGAGAGEFHTPNGDNLNTILSADATTLATLEALTLELVTNYARHLHVGALAMDTEI